MRNFAQNRTGKLWTFFSPKPSTIRPNPQQRQVVDTLTSQTVRNLPVPHLGAGCGRSAEKNRPAAARTLNRGRLWTFRTLKPSGTRPSTGYGQVVDVLDTQTVRNLPVWAQHEKGATGEKNPRPQAVQVVVLPYSMAALNQLVSEVGCVMPVPTTTAQAPASMAVLASAGVWTWPSQMIG